MLEHSLAQSAEILERDAMVDLFAAASPEFRAMMGLRQEWLGSGALLSLRAVSDPFYNRVIGLGLEIPFQASDIDALGGYFSDEGIAHWWLQLSPSADPAEGWNWVADRGLVPNRRSWAKFVRPPTPPPPVVTPLRIDEVGIDRAMDFAVSAHRGFGMPDPFVWWLSGLVGRHGWRCYVAYDGEQPVASAVLRLSDKGAWLGLGSTIPGARGRGAQPALLARRLADAAAAGAQVIAIETALPVPGEPAPSFRNICRMGFRVVHLRHNLERMGDGRY